MAESIVAQELHDGEFRRQESRFREWVGPDPRRGGETSNPLEPDRYHLYVSLACPWCHRVVIVRELAGLNGALPMYFLAPFRDERGWAFSGEQFLDGPGGHYVDPLHGWSFLAEGYALSAPSYTARVTAPVLWDERAERIVNNESSDLIRMLVQPDSLGGLARGPLPDLYPPGRREEIDEINARVYETVNNGVYLAGFARSQAAYERAFAELFESLRWLEAILDERRYLLGDTITEADWRLFPTLARFDEVYNLHFRCNYRRLVDYLSLWGYARELYGQPGVAQTVAMDQIKRHYYTTHDELNPKRIVPVGPGYDWAEPHGRGG